MAKQILAKQGIKIPVITTLHGTDITLVGRDKTYAPVVAFSINQSDAITAVSNNLRDETYKIFKIEKEICTLLQLCRSVLSKQPLFVFFTSHTPGMTPKVLEHLLLQMMQGIEGEVQGKEMLLSAERGFPIPSGSVARWTR